LYLLASAGWLAAQIICLVRAPAVLQSWFCCVWQVFTLLREDKPLWSGSRHSQWHRGQWRNVKSSQERQCRQ